MERVSIGRALYELFTGVILSIYCYRSIRVYLSNHLNIGIWKLFKQKTTLPHPVGIVIGFKVILGKGCIIYQNVTIGTKDTKNFKNAPYPIIGDNVTIYANSIIIGDISIGDNVIIGAGAIVLNDIPSNSIVIGNPAKILNRETP
jgi:serine acetyltransferase